MDKPEQIEAARNSQKQLDNPSARAAASHYRYVMAPIQKLFKASQNEPH